MIWGMSGKARSFNDKLRGEKNGDLSRWGEGGGKRDKIWLRGIFGERSGKNREC